MINRLQSAILIFADCVLYCAQFAVSLNKKRRISAIQTKKLCLLFCIALNLLYLCKKKV